MAKKCANDYIDKFQKDTSMEKRSQIAFLRYLMFYVDNVSPNKFVSSNEIQAYLQDYIGERIKKNFLFRRIVAPLRDSGLILSSSNKGYKIPISVEDIITYLNQTHTTVAPMLHRMEVCRNLILQYTGGELDVLNDPVFSRYKNYFE